MIATHTRQDRYDRLRAVVVRLKARPTKALLAQFVAIVEEMPAEQRAAVYAAVKGASR